MKNLMRLELIPLAIFGGSFLIILAVGVITVLGVGLFVLALPFLLAFGVLPSGHEQPLWWLMFTPFAGMIGSFLLYVAGDLGRAVWTGKLFELMEGGGH